MRCAPGCAPLSGEDEASELRKRLQLAQAEADLLRVKLSVLRGGLLALRASPDLSVEGVVEGINVLLDAADRAQ